MCRRDSFKINFRSAAVFAAVGVLLLVSRQFALAADSDEPKKSLEDVLKPAIEAHHGEVGVAVKHLKTGETYEYKADRAMPTASLIKLPVMIATYEQVDQGKLSLTEMIELKKDDQVQGSGILTAHFSPGTKISLRDAIRLMIVYSDNTATNLVLDQLGLPTTNECMERLGCPDTKINSKVFRRDTSIDKERSRRFGLGSTSARDMVKLCELVYGKKVVNAKACKDMLDHLYACDDKLKVPRLLPPGTRVAHKTGSVNESRTDAGIIESSSGPIAYCILTDKNRDRRWTDDNEGDRFCAEVGAAIYKYFNAKDKAPIALVAQKLQSGASGDLVEALQRTLNARIKPSPGIGVDGDYGPETENTVKKFQTQEKLKVTGIVDAETWRALGPLVMDKEPAPEPAVVNAEKNQKASPDSLDGPPIVTCKAWAIIDGATGEFLAGDNQDTKRDPASTTKMMTAYLVTRLAEKDPSVLKETVTFSERADNTPGSTSDVKAGEKLPVEELLFGMMLPSGNDAAVAFAEHFGGRLASDEDKAAHRDSHDCFIGAMNRTAEELGMKHTHFNNPNGLPSAGHQTTARDLAHLAFVAFQVPEFRKVVGTPRHGYTLDSITGYRRNIEWRNTNQLLKIEGYDGIKTGTTGAAGNCIVSTGERNGRRLIIAVLGSPSTEGRYADSRNLYRWAWKDVLKMGGPIVLTDAARKLHASALVIDGHNDMPWEVRKQGSSNFDKMDISRSQPTLQTDIPRLRIGGVGAQFWSVWVPVEAGYRGEALSTTLEQIDLVKRMMVRYPETFELALTADDIDRIHQEGKIASLIGVEGGHCIEESLNALEKLYSLGARYMTLTHTDSLSWADSATDAAKNNGLTPFGKQVVRKMNELGMLVDISHVSAKTMNDVLDVSEAPVIFSHSSAQAVADNPRNVPDDVLKRLRDKDGVVMVNFFSGYVVPAAAKTSLEEMDFEREIKKKYDDPKKVEAEKNRWKKQHPYPRGTIHDVLDHIDHIAKVAGVERVGIGSDFDGVSKLPTQLDDVSCYPYITQGLLDRGYTEEQIRGILGGNLMRVFRGAEAYAVKHKKTASTN